MKVNKKKLIIWLLVIIVWSGTFLVLNYTVGQHYGKNVATQQFDEYTTAYKELKTQKAVENGINLIGVVGVIFFLYMAGKQFKIVEEK